ncbi:NAD-dependent epimerase/dehydratase family protein [Mangrovimicrobium sediminis]|uniref:NAD-dependent epimerase/dehydratase family protein n=1 Tax=Mangrovimicrobium sediminis TaxID=2562682 RepID=UPI00143682A1|nr:NAD-dependent epimerase/dehydratase family protein [Haliea sp. SAOS-164]
MKCLVTGATGFIGRELCPALQRAGHEVVAWSGSGAALPGLPTVAVDLTNWQAEPEAMAGVDTVFHLAAIAHREAPAEEHQRLNCDAVLALARAASHAGVRRFVFVSSVKAMGAASTSAPRTEEDTCEPQDAYGAAKWGAEQGLRELAAASGMSVVILRPALVYAPGAAGNLALLQRAIALGVPRPPNEGARSMISRSDLVDLALCAAQADLRSQPGMTATWIAADGEAYSTQRLYDVLRAAAGKSPARAWLPRFAWRIGAAAQDLVAPGVEPIWQKLFGTELYDSSRAQREADWRPKQRFESVFPPAFEARS